MWGTEWIQQSKESNKWARLTLSLRLSIVAVSKSLETSQKSTVQTGELLFEKNPETKDKDKTNKKWIDEMKGLTMVAVRTHRRRRRPFSSDSLDLTELVGCRNMMFFDDAGVSASLNNSPPYNVCARSLCLVALLLKLVTHWHLIKISYEIVACDTMHCDNHLLLLPRLGSFVLRRHRGNSNFCWRDVIIVKPSSWQLIRLPIHRTSQNRKINFEKKNRKMHADDRNCNKMPKMTNETSVGVRTTMHLARNRNERRRQMNCKRFSEERQRWNEIFCMQKCLLSCTAYTHEKAKKGEKDCRSLKFFHLFGFFICREVRIRCVFCINGKVFRVFVVQRHAKIALRHCRWHRLLFVCIFLCTRRSIGGDVGLCNEKENL